MASNKQRLISQARPDSNISEKQTTDPKLYRVLKNFGDVFNSLINSNYPPNPVQSYEIRFILSGNPTVANDVLSYHYHIIMPSDSSGFWTFSYILLNNSFITSKVAPSSTTLSIDIKKQVNGTTTWKSLFQNNFNPTLPKSQTTSHNTLFAINRLFQDDILRVDVLATDASVSGIELVLTGNFVLVENN